MDETHLSISVPPNEDVLNIYERIGLPSQKTGDQKLAFMKDIQPGTQYLFELPPRNKPFGVVFKRETNPDEAIIFVHK